MTSNLPISTPGPVQAAIDALYAAHLAAAYSLERWNALSEGLTPEELIDLDTTGTAVLQRFGVHRQTLLQMEAKVCDATGLAEDEAFARFLSCIPATASDLDAWVDAGIHYAAEDEDARAGILQRVLRALAAMLALKLEG